MSAVALASAPHPATDSDGQGPTFVPLELTLQLSAAQVAQLAVAVLALLEERLAAPLATAVVLGIVVFVAVQWPVLVWSSLHGEPTLMDVGSAIGGGVHWTSHGLATDPAAVPAWRPYRGVLPPRRAWLALDVVGLT